MTSFIWFWRGYKSGFAAFISSPSMRSYCHSERSEESLFILSFMSLVPFGQKKYICTVLGMTLIS